MRNRDAHVTVPCSWEYSEGDMECEFILDATVSPADPGDYETPPSGPGVEFTSTKLLRTYSESGTREAKDIPERVDIEAAFLDWLDGPEGSGERDRLEMTACQQAADDDEGAREAAAEARAELIRERQEEVA